MVSDYLCNLHKLYISYLPLYFWRNKRYIITITRDKARFIRTLRGSNYMEDLKLHNYLDQEIKCTCGKVHSTQLKEIEISENALEKIPELVKKYNYKKVSVVSDSNTFHIAGEKMYQILTNALIETSQIILHEKNLVPDEIALGKIIVEIEPECDLIIAVGSGTINDICKFLSYKLGIDYFIVATAPSMDGFASNVSALIINQLKTTYETHVAKAIIGDILILKEAPMDMIIAGVGDILGKYVCLLDWKLAHMVQGEYHCLYIEEMIQKSLSVVVKSVKKIKERDSLTIKYIMEGLVLSGIAMSYAGNSRPASGSEHHLSHYWEMMFLFQKKEPVLHGIKVGVGLIVATKLYEKLRDSSIDFEASKEKIEQFNIKEWKKQIRCIYKVVGEDIIIFEEKVQKNNPFKVLERIEFIQKNWEEIRDTINLYLPSVNELIDLLRSIGAPTKPEQIGVDGEMLTNSILYAKDIRNRYGLLQILFDLSLYE